MTRPAIPLRSLLATLMAGMLAGGCLAAEATVDRSQLRQPTGLALAPGGSVLVVTNGNWDRRAPAGTITLIDLEGLERALAEPGAVGSGAPCRRVAGDTVLVCDPAAFIDPEQTVVVGDGVGNIGVDRPAGPNGPARLMIPTRDPAAVVWMDVVGAGVDCGQDDEGVCDEAHHIVSSRADPETDLPGEPARVAVGGDGFRFAYVPHLLGGAISLVALDGEAGPELVDVEGEFYRQDIFDDDDLAGGFAVVQRPCDPASAPESTRDCTRPLLYTTHRYFPGMRQFSVAPGLDRILGGEEIVLSVLNAGAVQGRPFMADLRFEDETGETLLAVQTTPPGLLRIDTSLAADGTPNNEAIGSLPLCGNPNAMSLFRPPAGEALALVACRGASALAVVGLGSFRILRTVDVGRGPSEVLVDAERGRAYVANTEDDTISIVGLLPTAPGYLRELARIGLGAGSRDEAPL